MKLAFLFFFFYVFLLVERERERERSETRKDFFVYRFSPDSMNNLLLR